MFLTFSSVFSSSKKASKNPGDVDDSSLGPLDDVADVVEVVEVVEGVVMIPTTV